MIKTVVKEVKNFALIFVLLVVAGYLLLVIAYALPTDRIAKNVAESSAVIEQEGTSHYLVLGPMGAGLDNYTDSLMQLEAEFENIKSPWIEALSNQCLMLEGSDSRSTLVSIASGSDGDVEYETILYARYWHGYLIFLKPLLLFFDYIEIRTIQVFLLFALTFIAVYLLGRKNKIRSLVPFIGAVTFLNPYVCGLSTQYVSNYAIVMLQFIIVLLFEQRYRDEPKIWFYHFFIVGALTSYFDLLSYPLVTLGIPLAFMVAECAQNFKDSIIKSISAGLLWGAGYGAMWVSKWILATLATGNNIISDAVNQADLRMETWDGYSRLDIIKANLDVCKPLLILMLALFVICIIVNLLMKRYRMDLKCISMLCIALLPFAWYCLMRNHSFVHSFMTFKILAIFIYAVLAFSMMFYRKNDYREI